MPGVLDHRLRRNLLGTYLGVRRGIVALALALPLVLWLGAAALDGTPLQGSISAYYYTGLRNVFVGALAAVGALLLSYKGFSSRENGALNLACAFVVVVALVPTTPPDAAPAASAGLVGAIVDFLTVHATAAVLFFLCLAYVALWLAGETLSLIRPEPSLPWNRTAAFYRRCYRITGGAMVLSPLVAVLVAFLTRERAGPSTYVFWLEALAVWSFTAYWWVKSREMRQTSAEQLGAAGALVRTAEGAPGSGRLVQVEPGEVEGLSEAELEDVHAWLEPGGAL